LETKDNFSPIIPESVLSPQKSKGIGPWIVPDRSAFSRRFALFFGPFANRCENHIGKRAALALAEAQLRALKPKDRPFKVADDRGSDIEVSAAGGKLWRFRYRVGPVEKKLLCEALFTPKAKHCAAIPEPRLQEAAMLESTRRRKLSQLRTHAWKSLM
jgi:hypothetical protein